MHAIVRLAERVVSRTEIPTDGRAHAGRAVQSYMGDARGRWDGETHVVETTNLTG